MQDYKALYEDENKLRIRNAAIIGTLSRWFTLSQKGYTLLDFFKERNCETIAIYGASRLGEHLILETEKDKSIRIKCLFDKNAAALNAGNKFNYPVYLPEQYKDKCDFDMLVVTAIFYYEEIRRELLMQRADIPIINLDRIINVTEEESIYASDI